jgi:hypothetical protein
MKTHQLYSEKHGFEHVVFEDTEATKEARGSKKSHWVKVQALMEVLGRQPRHPSVLYSDLDSFFLTPIPKWTTPSKHFSKPLTMTTAPV